MLSVESLKLSGARVAMQLRRSVRSLQMAKRWTAFTIGALALAIGIETIAFSLLFSIVYQPLRYANYEKIVWISETSEREPDDGVAIPTFRAWSERSRSLLEVAAFASREMTLISANDPERLSLARVTANLFSTLGTVPAMGRSFAPDDDRLGAAPVAVLSDALWRRRFGADTHVIGKQIRLDELSVQVVGVMPPGFEFPNAATDLWLPLGPELLPTISPRAQFLSVLGLMRSQVPLESLNSELTTLQLDIPELGSARTMFTPRAELLADHYVGSSKATLFILFGAVSLVLLIACANISGLILVRASAREHEIAIRVALGATRRILVHQLLAESAVLCIAGGALGVALAVGALRVSQPWISALLPRANEIGVGRTVLLFSAALTALIAVTFALVPALAATSARRSRVLQAPGARASVGLAQVHWRSAVMFGQTALAVALLAPAVLLVRDFARIVAQAPGLDVEGVSVGTIARPMYVVRNADLSGLRNFSEALGHRLESLPGVTAVAMSDDRPFEGSRFTFSVRRRGTPSESDATKADFQFVSAQYFQTLRIPILRGRDFSDLDGLDSLRPVVIGLNLARRLFPDKSPLGQSIGTEDFLKSMVVVGVVADVRQRGLEQPPPPMIYLPFSLNPDPTMTVLVRSPLKAAALASEMQAAVRSVDANQPLTDMQALSEVLDHGIVKPRAYAVAESTLAIVAVAVAAVGLYGLSAAIVGQRSREIGIRLALGASRFDVVRLIMQRAFLISISGVAAGVLLTVWAMHGLGALLFGVNQIDWGVALTAALLLLSVSLLASFIPAQRACAIDPAISVQLDA